MTEWEFVPASEALDIARTPPTTGWTLTALLAAKDGGYLSGSSGSGRR